MSLIPQINAMQKKRRTRNRGIVAVECALIFPFLLVVFVGLIDISYRMIVDQRVDRIAYAVADIITQSESLTCSDLNSITGASSQIMQPFSFFDGNGYIVVSSIHKATALSGLTLDWVYPINVCSSGGGSGSYVSRLDVSGTTVNSLPHGLTLNAKDNIIAVEVFYDFRPIFGLGVLHNQTIYKLAIYKPRLGSLVPPPTT